MGKRISWTNPVDGKVYHESDRRLHGRGNPPRAPLAPGMGTVEMVMTLTDDKGLAEEAGYREFPDTPAVAVPPAPQPAPMPAEVGDEKADSLGWEEVRSELDNNKPRPGKPQR
jgi:hypothetical protein